MNQPAITGQRSYPFVSIVMPAFNEERHIPASFEALALQDYPADRYEVVLIDNGSTDRTVEFAGRYADLLDLRVASKLGGSIAGVRNYGASLARGEIVVFLDCDCVAPPDWLRVGTMRGSPAFVWGAHYSTPEDAGWVARIWEEFQALQVTGPVSFLPSGNLWLYKSSFEQIGQFSTTQQTSEDVELCQRAKRCGLQVEAFPEISVVHYGSPEGLRRFYLQNRWHGKHVLRMFLRNLPKLTYLPLLGLSFYVLCMGIACIGGAIAALVSRHYAFFTLPLVLLLLPPFLLALVKTARRGRLNAMPQLFVLYATYFLARAAALVQPSVPRHR